MERAEAAKAGISTVKFSIYTADSDVAEKIKEPAAMLAAIIIISTLLSEPRIMASSNIQAYSKMHYISFLDRAMDPGASQLYGA